jgi:hypothetical protein
MLIPFAAKSSGLSRRIHAVYGWPPESPPLLSGRATMLRPRGGRGSTCRPCNPESRREEPEWPVRRVSGGARADMLGKRVVGGQLFVLPKLGQETGDFFVRDERSKFPS